MLLDGPGLLLDGPGPGGADGSVATPADVVLDEVTVSEGFVEEEDLLDAALPSPPLLQETSVVVDNTQTSTEIALRRAAPDMSSPFL